VHLIPQSLHKLEGVYESKGKLLAGAIARFKDKTFACSSSSSI
jgi:hypothetical protein